jgi:hypothetical protein
MARSTNRRGGPHQTARVLLWEQFNRHAGPFTYLVRVPDASWARLRVQSLAGATVEGWLTTALDEVCALVRVGDAWVLFDEFAADAEREVNVTVSADSFDAMADLVARVLDGDRPVDSWADGMRGAA